MTTNRLLLALIVLVTFGIGLPRLISDRPAPAAPARSATIDVSGMPAQGAADAGVAVIEFSDYECPYCARYATTVFPEVKDRFVSPGKVRYFFANFPLPNHRNAESLAAAAICAGEQDAYWKMHESLFASRPKTSDAVLDLGRQMGLQMQPFGECLGDSGPATERIRMDKEIAGGFQISGTPSFVLGLIDAQGKVVAQDLIVGAQPFSAFEGAITSLLSR
jgi:protein-disulfide isomerase